MKRPMMIPSVIGVLAALCVLPQALSAARVEAGIKFGVNFAFIHGADVDTFPGNDSDWVMRFGLCGGGFIALPLSENFAIQAEALVTTKGSKEVGYLFEENYLYSLMITYLEIPVLIRVLTPSFMNVGRISFMAGPALSFKLHSRFMGGGEVLDFNGVKSNDLGLVFSIGYVLGSRGYTEFRYTAGLSKIIEVEGVPLNIKNGVASVIVGFSF
jgi:hypothetical protein